MWKNLSARRESGFKQISQGIVPSFDLYSPKGKIMKKSLFLLISLLLAPDLWGMNYQKPIDKDGFAFEKHPKKEFRKNIPAVAGQFIGIPYQFGANPQVSGATDNSYLFFSIYTLAAQKAGLTYHGYLPMQRLLGNCSQVDPDKVQNGDLMVLTNGLAAMIFRVETSGKLHLVYASQKRSQVCSFNSDNLVFQVYWMENLKGFYRLSDTMLSPAK